MEEEKKVNQENQEKEVVVEEKEEKDVEKVKFFFSFEVKMKEGGGQGIFELLENKGSVVVGSVVLGLLGEGLGGDGGKRGWKLGDKVFVKFVVFEVYFQVMVILIVKRLLFFGFYKVIIIKDFNVVVVIIEMIKCG